MKKSICFIPDVDLIKTGILLKSLRMANHYTVQDIAIFAGISDKSVYAWEKGISIPSISNLSGLKYLYNLNHIDELLVFS